MSSSPTFTEDSQVLPGVKFTVQRIGLLRRNEIDKQTLPYRQRLRELELEYPARTKAEDELAEQLDVARRKVRRLVEGPDKPSLEVLEQANADTRDLARQLLEAAPLDVRKRRAVIDEEYGTLQGPIIAIWLKAGLVKLEGGEVDGMSVDELLDHGHIPLAQEIYGVLTGEGRLAGPDAKNSSSPGTSTAPEMPAMKATSVAPASEPANMPSETVCAGSLRE